jgi:hypothetical protein
VQVEGAFEGNPDPGMFGPPHRSGRPFRVGLGIYQRRTFLRIDNQTHWDPIERYSAILGAIRGNPSPFFWLGFLNDFKRTHQKHKTWKALESRESRTEAEDSP